MSSNVWFTSDWHLFHKSMAWFRQFGRWPTDEERNLEPDDLMHLLVEEHNERIIDNLCDVVRKGDQVWNLGDLTANAAHLDDALAIVKKLPGEHHIVFGNHDPAHPMHRDSWKWERKYDWAFASRSTSRERYVTTSDGVKHRTMLSHFPYGGDHEGLEDRCQHHRLRNEGRLLIHGHIHSGEQTSIDILYTPAETHVIRAAVQIHVGLDAWSMRPVNLDEVVAIMDRINHPSPVPIDLQPGQQTRR